jgi:uncharacterized protein YecT (DUF1311 family)
MQLLASAQSRLPLPHQIKTAGRLTLGALAIVALSACKPLGNLFGSEETPAQVCASDATMKEMAKLISESDEKLLEEARRLGGDPAPIRKEIQRYWSTGAASIDLAMLESVDETTQRITCKGQFVVKAIAGSKLATNSAPLVETSIVYFRQPSADGKSLIFGYRDPSRSISVLPAAMASMLAGNPQSGEMSTAKEDQVDGDSLGDLIAEGEAENPEFDASNYASAAACHKAATIFNDSLQCEELRKREDDAELAKALASAKSRLSEVEASHLDAAHKRWAETRNEECDAEASKEAAVFSAYASINNECVFARNRAQLKALASGTSG